jgi:hypothetical protein
VPEPRLQQLRVGVRGDEERGVRVSQVMEPHGLADGCLRGGEPEALSEAAMPERSSLRVRPPGVRYRAW